MPRYPGAAHEDRTQKNLHRRCCTAVLCHETTTIKVAVGVETFELKPPREVGVSGSGPTQ